MTEAARQLLESARTLSPEDQLWLADEIALLVDASDELDPAWNDEIKHRLDEIDSGKVRMIPAEEVHKKMIAKLSLEARARLQL
jgi:putative addiction module component (TIGR02574 family)